MPLLDAQDPPPSSQPASKDSSILSKILPFTTVVMLIAIGYVAYTFYSRHQADVHAREQLAEKEQAARERTVKAVFGDGEINFTSFSLDASSIRPGQTARLCYGVVNAVNVKIDPPIETLRPTYQHCMDVSPKQTTKYTITADDGKGHSKSESLELKVR